MSTFLDYRGGFLCVLVEHRSEPKKWFPVNEAGQAEVQTLLGRPLRSINFEEGIYVDEEGNVFQLADKGETKPIAVEPAGGEKSELEELLEASLNGGKERQPAGDRDHAPRKRHRSDGGKRDKAAAAGHAGVQSVSQVAAPVASAEEAQADDLPQPVALNLRQKLVEVRRRLGYVQKRGHNERFNYSYVTAADIAGSIGDLLAELGVLIIPRLEEISYESATGRGEAARMARVVMAYTFADVDSGEELTAKVAGQGLDAGDKAPYKAMTGALKYALLQSFLLATGDDPEEERSDGRVTGAGPERPIPINAEQVGKLRGLIEETGTELERVLAYYKLATLEEMTEPVYQRALEVLGRKLARQQQPESVHAEN
ncbi:MAG TPA: ERF family protein [Candidatus Binataceae bacterium]|nr:ERF family protein [Candidatus Binataceae bacterium]